MSFSDKFKNIFKKTTGFTIYKKLPFGVDELDDIKFRFKRHNFKIFIDVGANIGQSANHIRSHFSNAAIHSFEPIKNTFNQLIQNTKGKNINCHNIALGSKEEVIEVKISANAWHSDKNSILNDNLASQENFITETITVSTLSKFCKEYNLEFIDFLKIDTEGFDLEVIKGAESLLQNNQIAFIEAEVSMNAYNTFHIDYMKVKNYLEPFGYVLFGIYEQIHEWKPVQPVLRRSNAVFISKKMVDQFTQ